MSKFICCYAPRWQRTCVCKCVCCGVCSSETLCPIIIAHTKTTQNDYHMIWSWIFLFLYRAFCFLLKQWQATASARWRRWGFTCTRKLSREISSECSISVELVAFVFFPYITPYLHRTIQEGDFKWASERVSDERVSDERVSDERCVDAYS